MRFLLGWFTFFIVSAIGATALAQVKGEVESVGFGSEGFFRPTCWTPMVVRLTATTGAPFKGRIIVKQDDLDGDHVTFTRKFELSGNGEGGAAQSEHYWMYFLPQPGLAHDTVSVSTKELQQQLQVFVCDNSGNELAQLPITQGITSLSDHRGGEMRRGKKLLLCVVQDDKPQWNEYAEALGISEDVIAVQVPIGGVTSVLPESLLGYEAVDAVAWFDADPQKLTSRQRKTLEDYIRRGGQLVIVQPTRPAVWATVSMGLDNLMPVNVTGISQLRNLETLKGIELRALQQNFGVDHKKHLDDLVENDLPMWDQLNGPFNYATATLKPGSLVDLWFAPGSAPEAAPFIVRAPFGMGSVTWVAQDIADPNLLQRGQTSDKWIYVWNRIFDWAGNPIPIRQATDADRSRYGSRSPGGTAAVHLESSMLSGMELQSKGTALVGLAILFFIVYWVIAGPGAYLFLAARKRPGFNWFAFAAVGIVATVAAAGITRLVLRGAPKARHVSFVRIASDGSAIVRSQFGFYVPRDGYQNVQVGQKDPGVETADYVTPFPLPDTSDMQTFNAHEDYDINVTDPSSVLVFYRSTLKKLQTSWSGTLPGLSGNARLPRIEAGSPIVGRLANNTGAELSNVYFVFNRSLATPDTDRPYDTIFYLPRWDKNATIDLQKEYQKCRPLTSDPNPNASFKEQLDHHSSRDLGHWNKFFFEKWSSGGWTDENVDDEGPVPRSFPILSLFDRLPVMENTKDMQSRYELRRKGLRFLDVSQAISAGQLVVLAQADGPLPSPMKVDGDDVKGEGTVYYQFIMPLDRSELPSGAPAATPPASLPATMPAARSPGSH